MIKSNKNAGTVAPAKADAGTRTGNGVISRPTRAVTTAIAGTAAGETTNDRRGRAVARESVPGVATAARFGSMVAVTAKMFAK